MKPLHQPDPANGKARRPEDENEQPDIVKPAEHAAGESAQPDVKPISRDDAEQKLPPDPDPDDPVSP